MQIWKHCCKIVLTGAWDNPDNVGRRELSWGGGFMLARFWGRQCWGFLKSSASGFMVLQILPSHPDLNRRGLTMLQLINFSILKIISSIFWEDKWKGGIVFFGGHSKAYSKINTRASISSFCRSSSSCSSSSSSCWKLISHYFVHQKFTQIVDTNAAIWLRRSQNTQNPSRGASLFWTRACLWVCLPKIYVVWFYVNLSQKNCKLWHFQWDLFLFLFPYHSSSVSFQPGGQK